MSGYYDRNLGALDEVEDLLEAYADARLAPTGPVLSRMRAAVMAEAAAAAARQRALADAETARPSGLGGVLVRLGLPAVQLPSLALPRRTFAFGFAAALTLGTTMAVLAAPAGSPFFNARVAIENALLPAQPDMRLAAHEEHLQDRVDEAEAAANAGDAAALAAALEAFQAEMDAALQDVGADPDRLAHLEALLAKHLAKFEELAARLPTVVARQNALDHAIKAAQNATNKIKDKKAANQGNNGSQGNNAPSARPTSRPGNPGNPGPGDQVPGNQAPGRP